MKTATSYPRRIDADFATGFFKCITFPTRGKTQDPAPQGPGFGLQEPSVKATTVLLSQLFSIDSIMRLVSGACVEAVKRFPVLHLSVVILLGSLKTLSSADICKI